ncbi:hypothetical protein C9374_002021 [Naegleria lovaniensis]|uniref:Uncharacterized protein n=1 Tax=Naegleria lovaniensis TaxID=51637 RepID=A0AA88GRC1_NAELO|nr:uncharacterized protein C9374_002021 [Naegleria lovaniensis]KAG2386986.1 hypothetical protein C9374_002021 [Naegleria lovaniensis]
MENSKLKIICKQLEEYYFSENQVQCRVVVTQQGSECQNSKQHFWKLLNEYEKDLLDFVKTTTINSENADVILQFIFFSHFCGYHELVRNILDHTNRQNLQNLLVYSLGNYCSSNEIDKCELLRTSFVSTKTSLFGLTNKKTKECIIDSIFSKGENRFVFRFLKLFFNEEHDLSNIDIYSVFKSILNSVIVCKNDEANNKRRKTGTNTPISRYNNYKFNLREIICLSDHTKIRQFLLETILSVIFSETMPEQLQLLCPPLLEHEILNDEEMQTYMLEWFGKRDTATILQIFNSLSVVQQSLLNAMNSRSSLILIQSHSFKTKIMERFSSIFFSEEEILLKKIDSSNNDNELILPLLEEKTVHELVSLLECSMRHVGEDLSLGTLYSACCLIQRLCHDHNTSESELESLLQKIRLQLMVYVGYCVKEYCECYREAIHSTTTLTLPPPKIMRKDSIYGLLSLVNKIPGVFFDTSTGSTPSSDISMMPLPQTIAELLSKIYLFTKVLEYEGCCEVVKDLSEKILKLIDYSNTDLMNNYLTIDDIKEIFSAALNIVYCIVMEHEHPIKTPATKEQRDLIKTIASLFLKEEGLDISIAIVDFLNYLLYTIHKRIFKAVAPQALYFLCVLMNKILEKNQLQSLDCKTIYSIINFIGAIIEAHAHHFSSTLAQDTENKKTLCFLFIDECLKVVVYYYSQAIPLFEKVMKESNLSHLSRYDLIISITANSLLPFSYLRNLFFIISYEHSTVGIKLLAGMEKMNRMAVDFSNYLNSFISIASDANGANGGTNKIDINISVSLCKVIFGIFEQYIQAKDKNTLSRFENWPKFVDTTLQLFDPSLVTVLISSLRKVYYEIVDIDSVVWHLLEKLSLGDLSSHPYVHFLEVLEKTNEQGVNFMTKYNSVIVLERAFKNTTPLLLSQSRSDMIDTVLNFCKNHRVLYRLLGLVNVKAVADDLKEESLMNYFSYYESLLGTLYPLLSMIPMNEEYAMEFVSRSQVPKCLIVFLQNNQKHIIKKHPKLLACIFKLYEKSLQIFITFAKLNPTHQKLEETRNDLFSKTFVFIVKFCFERIQPANQQTFFWSRPDDEEREVPYSFVNILKAITDAATNTAIPIIATLFKDYLQTLKETNVKNILQNVELSSSMYQQKVKSILLKLSPDSNKPLTTTLPQIANSSNISASATLKAYSKFPSFAKPQNTDQAHSPMQQAPNAAQKQVATTGTSLVPKSSSPSNSGTTPPTTTVSDQISQFLHRLHDKYSVHLHESNDDLQPVNTMKLLFSL